MERDVEEHQETMIKSPAKHAVKDHGLSGEGERGWRRTISVDHEHQTDGGSEQREGSGPRVDGRLERGLLRRDVVLFAIRGAASSR